MLAAVYIIMYASSTVNIRMFAMQEHESDSNPKKRSVEAYCEVSTETEREYKWGLRCWLISHWNSSVRDATALLNIYRPHPPVERNN